MVIFFVIALILVSAIQGIVFGETSGESQLNEEFRQQAKAYDVVNFHPV